MTSDEAEGGYLLWTNRLLSVCRADAKKTGQSWIYASVTERQKRGHPHSHFLSTYLPHDAAPFKVWKWQTVEGKRAYVEVDVYKSEWFRQKCVAAGLGEQYDISRVRDQKKVSRYVAKYMFKQSAFEGGWPIGWRRVRYSQSFPKLPERDTEAFVLMKSADWQKLAGLAQTITCNDAQTFERTNAIMRHYFFGKIKLTEKVKAVRF